MISALGATKFKGPNGPEFVDWEGVRNVVDAAQAKGENYLRASGVSYTVIRPGGLADTEPFQHAIVFRQGDNLPYGSRLSVTSRGDVARMCIAAIDEPAARNKTLEAFTDSSMPHSAAWADDPGGLLSD
ncbi:MAG: NAD(P)H-binding protein [Gammaproteobacteria bacterium]|nr:NAD(P)H-binding protein [Gammaproteobacteria bacterium]